jgi:hypothetical protein
VNDWREIYKYNVDGQPTQIVREIWFDEEWIDDSREVYSYDNNGNLIMIQYQLWTTDEVWKDYERVQYQYSENDNLVHGKHELLEGEDWIAENGTLEFYDNNDNHFYFGRQTEITVHYDGVTNIENNLFANGEFELSQNYPNPFNPLTKIKYSVPSKSRVNIKIFDLLGNEVITLIDKVQTRGTYKIDFNGNDLTSGVYFYRLISGDYNKTMRMILLK